MSGAGTQTTGSDGSWVRGSPCVETDVTWLLGFLMALTKALPLSGSGLPCSGRTILLSINWKIMIELLLSYSDMTSLREDKGI